MFWGWITYIFGGGFLWHLGAYHLKLTFGLAPADNTIARLFICVRVKSQ